MADLAASIAKARKAGYSDAEIAAYIAKDPSMGPKVAAARKAGYSDADVIKHLGKPSVVKDVVKSGWSGLRQGMAGVMDMALSNTPVGQIGRMSPTNPFGMARPENVTGNLFSRYAAGTSHKPQTTAGEYARTAGQMAPNLFAPGSIGAKVANWALPALASETAGQVARASGAGEMGETISRGVGALAGAGAASVRPQNIFANRPPPTPVDRFATRARPDPAAMQRRATEMRAAGVQPTLVDVAGERGRRVVRAVGVKGEEAGEALTENAARVQATTKPAAMAATRRLNNDPRTASQFADDMEATRGATATQNYGQFDAEQIEIPDTVRDMLADSSGRSIIARARADAVENQDWGRQVELDRLLQAGAEGGVGPLPRISAGTVDRLVIAARERGAAFARRGNNNRARGAFGRRDQLDRTLENVEELRPARQTYQNQSRAIEVARGEGRLDPFSTDPTDYAAWMRGLPPEARQANQIAIRQEIMDTLGGQRTGGSLGTLDDLGTSPYAQANLREAFGDQADGYLAEINARLAQTRNASFVNPNAGSRTAVLEQDVGNQAQQAVGAFRQAASGDVLGLAARAADAWRRRGITPEQAEELARLAVDPAQTDDAIRAITARLAPQQRQEFLSLRNAALVGGLATSQSLAASPAQ